MCAESRVSSQALALVIKDTTLVKKSRIVIASKLIGGLTGTPLRILAATFARFRSRQLLMRAQEIQTEVLSYFYATVTEA